MSRIRDSSRMSWNELEVLAAFLSSEHISSLIGRLFVDSGILSCDWPGRLLRENRSDRSKSSQAPGRNRRFLARSSCIDSGFTMECQSCQRDIQFISIFNAWGRFPRKVWWSLEWGCLLGALLYHPDGWLFAIQLAHGGRSKQGLARADLCEKWMPFADMAIRLIECPVSN
jgi:hypothetical protein